MVNNGVQMLQCFIQNFSSGMRARYHWEWEIPGPLPLYETLQLHEHLAMYTTKIIHACNDHLKLLFKYSRSLVVGLGQTRVLASYQLQIMVSLDENLYNH